MGREKAPHHCIQYEKKEKKKKRKKIIINFGRSFSFGIHILRDLFCICIGLLVRGGDESITYNNNKKNVNGIVERGEKWRRHRSPSTDGQVASARNTVRCVYVHMHKKKEKRRRRKKKRGLCDRIDSFMKKEKKRKRCSPFLLCAPSSTSKKAFSEPAIH